MATSDLVSYAGVTPIRFNGSRDSDLSPQALRQVVAEYSGSLAAWTGIRTAGPIPARPCPELPSQLLQRNCWMSAAGPWRRAH